MALAARDPRTSLQQPMELGALTIDVDCAVGVALHPEHGADAATLLQRADVATHAAKVRQSAVQLFTPSLESRSVRRMGLAADLRTALDAGEVQVYFQPKVALSDRRLVGVECLARWEHPVHGPVTPHDFVAVAEHTGQLGRLTEVVLREAAAPVPRAGRRPAGTCRWRSTWPPRTLLDPRVSGPGGGAARGVRRRAGPADVGDHRGRCGGRPGPPGAALEQLRELGVRLSVDDFGAGYSSLSLPAPAAGAGDQDRPGVRAGHGDRPTATWPWSAPWSTWPGTSA